MTAGGEARTADVFVVDDDASIRESLRFMLEGAGHRVECYASGRAFLAAHKETGRGCVVTDVRMPDMSGLELQAELRRRGSPLVVIVMTGNADVPMAVQAMKAGAAEFVEKPFDGDAMLEAIARALAHAPTGAAAPAAAPEGAERLQRLTPRERDLLEPLVQGQPHKVIAHALGISPRTVEVHRARIMQKLGARNHADLIRVLLAQGYGSANKG